MVTPPSDPVLRSYLKTLVASALLVPAALLFGILGIYWLPGFFGSFAAAVGALVALAFLVLALAGGVVLVRHRDRALGKADLFLRLNRPRDAAAITAAPPSRAGDVRRWLARRFLGHDLVVGDRVEIKSWEEIRATLDEQGCLEGLPFMPEMAAKCGQLAYVFRCAHRLFDYRKTRLMRHMKGAVLLVEADCDGSHHGGCEAACYTIWKAAWLRRVEKGNTGSRPSAKRPDVSVLQFGTRAPRYTCQLTQLHAASQPVGKWSATNLLRPLIGGNVAPAAFIVGWLTHLFDELQGLRRGV